MGWLLGPPIIVVLIMEIVLIELFYKTGGYPEITGRLIFVNVGIKKLDGISGKETFEEGSQ